MAADGSGDHPLTNSNDPPINMIPRWSPDTQSLAYVSGDHIWTMKVDGTGKKQITSGNFIDLAPTYAPDGQHIAFSSNRSGTFNLWVMSADGTIMTQMTHTTTDPTTGFPIEQKAPVWSPDFRTIAYFQGVGDNNLSAGLRNGTSGPTSTDLEIFATWNIWLMDSNGSNQRLLVPGDDPAWSPDSSKILRPTLPIYSFTPPEVTGVGTINIDGTGRTTLFTTGTGPSGFSWQGGA
jgi:TolB protein